MVTKRCEFSQEFRERYFSLALTYDVRSAFFLLNEALFRTERKARWPPKQDEPVRLP